MDEIEKSTVEAEDELDLMALDQKIKTTKQHNEFLKELAQALTSLPPSNVLAHSAPPTLGQTVAVLAAISQCATTEETFV